MTSCAKTEHAPTYTDPKGNCEIDNKHYKIEWARTHRYNILNDINDIGYLNPRIAFD